MNSYSNSKKSSSYKNSDYLSNHRAIINNSKISSVNSSSCSSGSRSSIRDDINAKSQVSPSSYSPKYLSFTHSSRPVSSLCTSSNNNHNNTANNNIIISQNTCHEDLLHHNSDFKSKIGKAPADYTSDSDDLSERCSSSTNDQLGKAQFTSRATSPKLHSSGRKSTEKTDFISATEQIFRPKKTVFGTAAKKVAKEVQVDEITCNSLEMPTEQHSQPTSPQFKMRYGYSPNHRSTYNSYNRYSMPTIRSSYNLYSSLSSKSNINQNDQNESIKTSSQNIMIQPPEDFQDKKENNANGSEYKDYNDNTLKPISKNSYHFGLTTSKSPSPLIIRKTNSKAKLSERSRSSSGEFDQDFSSTDSDEQEPERKIRRRRRRKTQEIEFPNVDQMNLKNTSNDLLNMYLPERSASAEPMKNVESKDDEISRSCLNINLDKPKLAIKKPSNSNLNSTPKPNQNSYLKPCDCEDSEFLCSESDIEKIPSISPMIKINLTPSPEDSNMKTDSTDDDTCSDITEYENNCLSIKKLRGQNLKFVRKSPTVIEINNNNNNEDECKNMNSIQKCSTIEIVPLDQSQFEYKDDEDEMKQRKPYISPFPKENQSIMFSPSSINERDCIRDSGFSEISARPESPYDNLQTETPSLSDSDNSKSSGGNQSSGNKCDVDDIDAFLLESFESFEEFERKMNCENKQKFNNIKNDIRQSRYKCQDYVDRNFVSNSCESLPKVIEEDYNYEDSVAVDPSEVKVHHTKPMQSRV